MESPKLNRREFLKASGVVALGATITWSVQAQEAAIDPDIHVLSRLSWGIRPQDIDRIKTIGREAYIDEQLSPDSLANPKLEQFLSDNPLLAASEDDIRQTVRNGDYGDTMRLALWSRLYRAIYSERQLEERMVEFWNDHFNVPIPDYLPERMIMDREVIRRHALGSFRELLFATAQNSAMLLYLDNASNDKTSPNENYARELLELHTLGVTGGYSEDDVWAVARAFTGWTLRDGWPGRFYFDDTMHDTDEKMVLGQRMAAGRGIEDGLQVLDLLASHPSTARFISQKLCAYFVSDEPPENLIESTTQAFRDSEGNIATVLRHIFLSNAFMASAGQKLRRPMDYVVAVTRTFGDDLILDNPEFLRKRLELMGHLPYMWHPPNGYPQRAEAWLNTNGLLHRWNLAMHLTRANEDWFEEAQIDFHSLVPPSQSQTVGALIDTAANRLLFRPLSEEDRAQFVFLLSDYGDANQDVDETMRRDFLPAVVGLLLASPYFQWT